MSKTARKNRLSKKQPKPPKQKFAVPAKQKSKKKFVVFVIVAILAAIPFGLGRYFELNFPDPFDSGGYVYSAKHILDGAEIGVEEKPSAKLGTLMVNILGVWLFGFNETGPKLIQSILQAAALALMFIAMRKLFGTLAAAVGVIIASIYLSAPLIAKFGNVKEQHMIAFMVMGISCLVLRQLDGKWWWAFLAGAFVSWAPLFKETGTSAISAMGLFVFVQPILKHRTWKQTGVDILLLLAGAAAAIGPLYVWIIAGNVHMSLPYSFIWKTIGKMLPAGGGGEQAKVVSGYIGESRELIPFAKQWPRVLRYYGLLILPIALAASSIAARIVKMIFSRLSKYDRKTTYDRFVLLFAVWWLLDMAFVWISPRSYEQYYLPLNASAAMLGGYLIAVYHNAFSASAYKGKWTAVGVAGFVCMVIMSLHIFFGIEKSPHSGTKYPQKRRGYAQKLNEISRRRRDNLKGAWEIVGEYIRIHSEPTDKIYVWGWYPGIYVSAQRFSSAAEASMIPQLPPQKLSEIVTGLIAEFEQEQPKFIVDSRKRHVPMDRPPHELWPIAPKGFMEVKKAGFLPLDKGVIAAYDKWWSNELRKRFGEDEALRYEAMQPFREFVMKNYRIVQPFGQHVLFERK